MCFNGWWLIILRFDDGSILLFGCGFIIILFPQESLLLFMKRLILLLFNLKGFITLRIEIWSCNFQLKGFINLRRRIYLYTSSTGSFVIFREGINPSTVLLNKAYYYTYIDVLLYFLIQEDFHCTLQNLLFYLKNWFLFLISCRTYFSLHQKCSWRIFISTIRKTVNALLVISVLSGLLNKRLI